MSYYWFYKEKLLRKAKNKYHNGGGKNKAAKYYIANKYVIQRNANKKYRSLSEEENEAKRKYQGNRYKNI